MTWAKESLVLSFLLSWFIWINAAVTDQPQCQDAACYQGWRIKKLINPAISPCTDFYRHVCDKFATVNEEHSFISEASKLYDEEKRLLLQEPIKPDDTEATKKVKEHYRVCSDVDKVNANILARIKAKIDGMGGWPMLMSAERKKGYDPSWIDIHNEYVRKYGAESSIFEFSVNIDYRNYSNYLLMLDRSSGPFGIATPREWEDDLRAEYIIFILNLFSSVGGVEASRNEIVYSLYDVFQFRRYIDELRSEVRANEIMTIDNWQKLYDSNSERPTDQAQIDWLFTVQTALHGVKNVVVNDKTEISVLGKVYMLKLIQLLKDTKPQTIVDHLHLYFLEKNLKYTNDWVVEGLRKLYDRFSVFDPQLYGDRHWKCFFFLNMPHAVDKMFVNKRIPAGFLDNVTGMYTNIKEELKKEIQESRRVEDAGKMALIEKVDNITGILGFPAWYDDEARIDGFYKDITIGSDFLQNMLSIERHNYVRYMSTLRSDSDREPRPLLRITNAYYQPGGNNIELSLSILRPPFFHILWPDEIKYAMAGSVIGHEISHGFDYRGYRSGARGSEASWLTDSDNSTFERVADCYAEQYLNAAKQIYPETTLNPYFLLTENMADGQGARITYRAYKANRKPPTKIKYLEEYTPDQIYFLAFAMAQCSAESLEDTIEKVKNVYDPHAISSFRVNGPLANLAEFSNAFACKPGTPMNPTKKCNIWA